MARAKNTFEKCKMKENAITLQEIKRLISYNPRTGKLYWKKASCAGARHRGEAGVASGHGYKRIMIDGVCYNSHRIAWLFLTGSWPVSQIDHINGVRDDNRAENLREVTNRINLQNTEIHRKGKRAGASFDRPTGKWRSRIGISGRVVYLGLYDTEEEAVSAYTSVATANDIGQAAHDLRLKLGIEST